MLKNLPLLIGMSILLFSCNDPKGSAGTPRSGAKQLSLNNIKVQNWTPQDPGDLHALVRNGADGPQYDTQFAGTAPVGADGTFSMQMDASNVVFPVLNVKDVPYACNTSGLTVSQPQARGTVVVFNYFFKAGGKVLEVSAFVGTPNTPGSTEYKYLYVDQAVKVDGTYICAVYRDGFDANHYQKVELQAGWNLLKWKTVQKETPEGQQRLEREITTVAALPANVNWLVVPVK